MSFSVVRDEIRGDLVEAARDGRPLQDVVEWVLAKPSRYTAPASYLAEDVVRALQPVLDALLAEVPADGMDEVLGVVEDLASNVASMEDEVEDLASNVASMEDEVISLRRSLERRASRATPVA